MKKMKLMITAQFKKEVQRYALLTVEAVDVVDMASVFKVIMEDHKQVILIFIVESWTGRGNADEATARRVQLSGDSFRLNFHSVFS